ncbi:hypothetical protein ACLB6K_24215 (plasmid) [Microcystis aeruginosa FACHB-524]|uniref:hypothetical protein n=1 Tax=Microcystis aeruginosa TaxID=1126 RepID=UPI000F45235B|nr:hypothetical protein [Microcystis aeruginosa]ROI11893.1 hypothetical protein ED562_03000 [Microcystis aeruginosa FACHB-524]
MNERYYEIYDQLYRNYSYTSAARSPLGPAITRIIDEQIEFLHLVSRIRPDAKLFLLVNFTDVILSPLIVTGVEDQNILLENTAEDIKAILVAASQVSSLRGRNNEITIEPIVENRKISSHDVLIAVQSIWSLLRTLRIEVWGD